MDKEAPFLYLTGICFSEDTLIQLFGGMGKNTQGEISTLITSTSKIVNYRKKNCRCLQRNSNQGLI
ncbi:hypothetical protein NGI46_10735 [Peribacillus butanolivorans]|nr:hypothetical protein [Peribacillus butanolivorans]